MTRRAKKPAGKSTASPLQEQCWALSAAIRHGARLQANIRGTMYTIISLKSEPAGVSLLFHDEQHNLCLLKDVQVPTLEFVVRIGSEGQS